MMISRIGKKNAERPIRGAGQSRRFGSLRPSTLGSLRGGGFTLIEMILVMALLAIVLAIAFPSLKNFFRGRNLQSEAIRFLALTRYGQSRAISEGTPMLLWIKAQQGQYGLMAQPGYGPTDTNALAFTLDKNLQLQTQTAPLVMLARSNLWSQMPRFVPGQATIRFLPDGFIDETSPARIAIRQDGESIWIAENFTHTAYAIQSDNAPAPRP